MTNRNNKRSPGPKRATIWLPFHQAAIALAASGSVATGDLLARYQTEIGREVPVGTTLGPIRGNISVLTTGAAVHSHLFAAIQLITEGGSTVLPSLELEPIDAMWYGVLDGRNQTVESAAGVFTEIPDTFPIQTKAMRKVREVGQQLHLVFNEVSGDAAVTLTVGGHIFMKFP